MSELNLAETAKDDTTKQMGDACEMLVAAELTLAGIPAVEVPDNWPDCGLIAEPRNRPLQRVSVKSRTFKKGAAVVAYDVRRQFDWLAIVLLGCEKPKPRRFSIVPRSIADV